MFTSSASFTSHLRKKHAGRFADEQLPTIVGMRGTPISNDTTTPCTLCEEQLSSLKRLQRHLARHQEELALFALPRSFNDEDEAEAQMDDVSIGSGRTASESHSKEYEVGYLGSGQQNLSVPAAFEDSMIEEDTDEAVIQPSPLVDLLGEVIKPDLSHRPSRSPQRLHGPSSDRDIAETSGTEPHREVSSGILDELPQPTWDDKYQEAISGGYRWTKIDRRLVNPQALEEADERFEERIDCVIVLRVLTKEEIQILANKTREIRERGGSRATSPEQEQIISQANEDHPLHEGPVTTHVVSTSSAPPNATEEQDAKPQELLLGQVKTKEGTENEITRVAEDNSQKEGVSESHSHSHQARESSDSTQPGQIAPVKFKDALGRTFALPWANCNRWNQMEHFIEQLFSDVDEIGPLIRDGRYDLLGPSGQIVLPQLWDTTVRPGMEMSMHMWPMYPGLLAAKPSATVSKPAVSASGDIIVESSEPQSSRGEVEKKKDSDAQEGRGEDRVKAEMATSLKKFGYTGQQIQAIMQADQKRSNEIAEEGDNSTSLQYLPHNRPTYVKVHREHLSLATLNYYDIPWEYDSNDKDYFILMKEMDERETDILFEHTRRLRAGVA